MEELQNENIEQSSEVDEQSSEVSEQSSEADTVSEVVEENSDQEVTEELSDRNFTEWIQTEVSQQEQKEDTEVVTDEEIEEETEEVTEEVTEEETEEETPSSTVIQVVENPDSDTGFDVTELDVESLNMMSESYVDSMLAVTPTSNDYYTFIDSQVASYFSGVMANYPLNSYRAYHLRHWIYNSSYSSYYDDYYYLFYDYPEETCIEIRKPHDSNQYYITDGSAEILNSTITYGSEQGLSDLREGVNYVSWLSALCVLGAVLCLYIVHAIFRHIKS